MAILITSPGLVTTGTEGADDIRYQGGVTANGSVVNGLAGADTIQQLGSGGLNFTGGAAGVSINAGGGPDSIRFSAIDTVTSDKQSTILGGAGGDTITLTAAVIDQLKAGDGADVVTIDGGTYSGITLGEAADTLNVSAFVFDEIKGGAGNDIISGNGVVSATTGAVVFGGGGSDTITLTLDTNTVTGVVVNGDSTTDGGAADVITIGAFNEDSTVKGKGGSDTITVTTLDDGGVLAGNAGGDRLIASNVHSGSAVNGGQGADTIGVVFENAAGTVNGGGGADSISLSTANLGTVTFGAGTDKLIMTGSTNGFADGFSGALIKGSMSDSTVDSTDVVEFSGALVGTASFSVDVFNGNLSTGTVAAGTFLAAAGKTGAIDARGVFAFAAAADNVTSQSTIAGLIDQAATTAGTVVTFKNASDDDFLFIQGGAAGTADDFVLQIDNVTGGGTIGIGSSSVTLSGFVTAA